MNLFLEIILYKNGIILASIIMGHYQSVKTVIYIHKSILINQIDIDMAWFQIQQNYHSIILVKNFQ